MRRGVALLAGILLSMAFPVTGRCAAQPEMTAPETVLVGEVVTVRLTVPAADWETIAGTIEFDKTQLGYYKMEAASGWDIQQTMRDFSLSRVPGATGAPWLEWTFRVQNLPIGTRICFTVRNLVGIGSEKSTSWGDASCEMTVTESMSDENFLTELSVENGEFTREFHRDIIAYTVKVPADTKKVTVHAVAAPKAQISIDSPPFSREGRTTVTVTVTAENGAQRVYTLLVIRAKSEESAPPILTEPANTQPAGQGQETPGWVIAAAIPGGASLLGAAAILLERIVKKNR